MRIGTETCPSPPVLVEPQPRQQPREKDLSAREAPAYEPPPSPELKGHLIDRYV